MATLRDLEEAYKDAIIAKTESLERLNLESSNKAYWESSHIVAKGNYLRVRYMWCGGWKLYYWSTAWKPNCDIEKIAYTASSPHVKPKNAYESYPGVKNKYNSAVNKYNSAVTNFELAKKNSENAYDAFIEFKKANMTPQELADQLELEQKEKIFGLKRDIWKWIAIGGGVLGFIFVAFLILKRFKIKVPTPSVPSIGV